MTLIVEREPGSSTIMGSQMTLYRINGSETVISIPSKYSTGDVYQRLWRSEEEKFDSDKEPMMREVIVTNDGAIIHCKKPKYRKMTLNDLMKGFSSTIEQL